LNDLASLSLDGVNDVVVLAQDGFQEHLLELRDLGGLDFVEVTPDSGEDDADLVLSLHGNVLLLLEQLSEFLSSVEQVLGGSVEVGTELGEGSDFSVLGELQLERSSDLLHGGDLGGRSDSGDGQTDVDGGSDSLVEEFGFQEDLAVGDGDDVGGDESGHISGLRLDDGQGGERTTSLALVHLGGSLQKSRMEVEHVAGVGLSAWGSSQQQRHLSVGDGLLREIVVDDQSVETGVSEVLADGAARVGSQELKGSGLRGGGGDHDGVLERVVVLEHFDDVGHGGALLADGDVDAVEALGGVSARLEEGLLVEDGVDGDGSFSSLSISDDQLSLTSSNGNLFNNKKNRLQVNRRLSGPSAWARARTSWG